MGKIFIIAEKKEVGIQIVSCLSNKDWEKEIKVVKGGYYEDNNHISSWAMGHLFSQKKPNELNENWGLWKPLNSIDEYKMKDMSSYLDKLKTPSFDKYKKNQIQVLKSLFERKDIDKIIICTDADAEGEAIGRDILSLNKNKNIPVYRMWNPFSFKSKDAVNEAMKKILPINDKKYENLYSQQKARSNADYLLGMKITKNLSEFNGAMFETGRLKGLLVSILAKRELDIKNFTPKTYWRVNGLLNNLKFNHFYKNDDNEETSSYFSKDRLKEALDVFNKNKNCGIVELNETKESTTKERPLPLSGTDFSNEMMKKYKISLDVCNKILSFLREEGLTSYQGTNGRYFSENDKDEALLCIDVASKYFKNEPLVKDIKFNIKSAIFDNKKAEKQNHPPLTVRAKIPNDAMFKELETKSKLPFLKESYELILKRVICHFLENDLILKQKIIISIDGYKFKLEGSKAINQGWRTFMNMEIKDNTFDATKIKVGDKIVFDSINLEEDLTTAPKLYTIQKLANMMLNVSKEINIMIDETDDKERKKELEFIKKTLNGAEGIGTDRTRPTIISQLEEFGFFETKGKDKEISLLEKGWIYYEVLPTALKDFKLCANWENSFENIRNGDLSLKEFISSVDEALFSMIEEIHSKPKKNSSSSSSSSSKTNNEELVVTAKTYRLGDKFLFKSFNFKDLTKTEALKLLKGETIEVKRVSKADKPYTLKIKFIGDGKVEVIN